MNAREDALTLAAWSRVWSPLVPAAWPAEAWEALERPGRFEEVGVLGELSSSFAVDLDGFPY